MIINLSLTHRVIRVMLSFSEALPVVNTDTVLTAHSTLLKMRELWLKQIYYFFQTGTVSYINLDAMTTCASTMVNCVLKDRRGDEGIYSANN